MSEAFVVVLMGSDSDLTTMQATLGVFQDLGIPIEVKLTLAHRTPAATHAYAADVDDGCGCPLFIAAAGMAAHLAAQILSTADPALRERLVAERQSNAEAIVEKDARLQDRPKAET